MLKLSVEKRDSKVRLEELRKNGKMPAVFYGRKEESTPISIPMHEFEKTWREAGESTILSLEGVGEAKEALIHDVDVHPVTGKPRHADFYVIEKGKKLEVKVPLEFIGESSAVKEKGAVLVKVLHELDIEVLPKDLPHEITVDISSLKEFGDQISVKDLVLPEGVVAKIDGEEPVALVNEPKEEVEAPTEIDLSSITVEGEEKKKDDEAVDEATGETPAA